MQARGAQPRDCRWHSHGHAAPRAPRGWALLVTTPLGPRRVPRCNPGSHHARHTGLGSRQALSSHLPALSLLTGSGHNGLLAAPLTRLALSFHGALPPPSPSPSLPLSISPSPLLCKALSMSECLHFLNVALNIVSLESELVVIPKRTASGSPSKLSESTA